MGWPGMRSAGTLGRATYSQPTQHGGNLVAVTRAYGDTLAAGGAATTQYRGSALGFHAGAEAMRLHAAMAVGLKCALGHGKCAPLS